MQRHSQKPGCKEQKLFQLHILYSMASKEPKNFIWKKSRGEVASQTQLSFQIKIIIITEAHIRSPIGTIVLQILALQKQYFSAFTLSRTQVFNKIKNLEKVEMFQWGTLIL